jgi:hypothetical protein
LCREEKYIKKFWWGNLKEIDQVKDLGIDEKLLFKCVLEKEVGREWTGLEVGREFIGFIWLRTVTSGGFWYLRLYKMRGIS